MVKSVTKVVYKPDTHSTDEFVAMVNTTEFKKWKDGDTGIPLAEVVDSFEVFHSSQGLLLRPSRQQLENVFGTSKDVDVLTRILQNGKEQPVNGFSGGVGVSNVTRTNAVIDCKGKGTSGI
ncbi:ribosome maturation protein [Pisolithus marmoratus]|nr:ribosome maturation protein [Pisolithus marmoratus]